GSMMMTSMKPNQVVMEKEEMPVYQKKKDQWKGFSSDLVRASEVESPAPRNHFLRAFGQSDRETIEAAESEASVTQALSLMNGSIYERLTGKNSLLTKHFNRAEGTEAKSEVIFKTLLGRQPREHERAIMSKQFEGYEERNAYRNIVWALLNTREFAFVQ
ncbi:MAG: DUF1553 domain-containing protein, partial [Verrucomicrobiota bacterium]